MSTYGPNHLRVWSWYCQNECPRTRCSACRAGILTDLLGCNFRSTETELPTQLNHLFNVQRQGVAHGRSSLRREHNRSLQPTADL